MWLIPTKKEVKKEFDKIRDGFKERDKTIEKLRDKIEINALKIATLEGAYSVLFEKSHSLKSQAVPSSLKPKNETFETNLIKRIRNNKKSLVMAEIVKLGDFTPIPELFNKIVRERGLCSKASFYRYISSLKSQKLIENETKVET